MTDRAFRARSRLAHRRSTIAGRGALNLRSDGRSPSCPGARRSVAPTLPRRLDPGDPFQGGVHPQHTERLAAYWAEQLAARRPTPSRSATTPLWPGCTAVMDPTNKWTVEPSRPSRSHSTTSVSRPTRRLGSSSSRGSPGRQRCSTTAGPHPKTFRTTFRCPAGVGRAPKAGNTPPGHLSFAAHPSRSALHLGSGLRTLGWAGDITPERASCARPRSTELLGSRVHRSRRRLLVNLKSQRTHRPRPPRPARRRQ